MDELVRWLGEQLDIDAQVAREATPGPWQNAPTARHHATASGRSEEAVFASPPDVGAIVVAATGEASERRSLINAEFIAAHDPARVLREINAKRAILARYEFACGQAADERNNSEEGREVWVKVAGALQSCVLCLAGPYADRPDFRKEWAL
jgi:hypothetical protein